LEAENRSSVSERNYEQTLSSLYKHTGVIKIDYSPTDIAWDGYNFWVSEGQDNFIQKIDPWEGRVVAELEVGGYPSSLAWDGVSLWAANRRDSTVQQIGVQELEVVRTIQVADDPASLIWDGNSLWVLSDSVLQRIDVHSGEIITEVALGIYPLSSIMAGDSILIAGEGYDHDFERTSYSIHRVDINSPEINNEFTLNYSPRAIA
jgi:hypothetical protein